jgi:hypothetical protein
MLVGYRLNEAFYNNYSVHVFDCTFGIFKIFIYMSKPNPE